MPINSWRKILYLALLVLPIISLDLFLKSPLYFNLLKNQNGPSYFYLSYDWLKKAQIAIDRPSSESTLYLGSSRTAYAFDEPSLKNSEHFNLSLMAASYREIELLVKAMLNHNVRAAKIYFELNPTSATLRHMKAMSSQDAEKLFTPYLSSSYLAPIEIFVSKNSLSMNRLILRDFISTAIFPQNDSFDDYKKLKRASHVKEFQEMNSPNYNGFINPMNVPAQHYIRSFSECSTMLNWIMGPDKNDDLSEGKRIFSNLIDSLKKITPHLIIWIPPSPPGKAPASRENFIIEELFLIAKSKSAEIHDLRSLKDYEDSDFFDCVHPNKTGADKIRSLLFKN